MSVEVKLHGGPKHGQHMIIPRPYGRIKIAGFSNPLSDEKVSGEAGIRIGYYSPVTYHKPTLEEPELNYEWDGWEEKGKS